MSRFNDNEFVPDDDVDDYDDLDDYDELSDDDDYGDDGDDDYDDDDYDDDLEDASEDEIDFVVASTTMTVSASQFLWNRCSLMTSMSSSPS
ncbi:hypothetical protein JCM18918_4179 [Cutibacterium acnes JCM 18918]|nr:hypothetical protein JCM18918_4179 [Cutibacterium acnes JCM 18918]